MWAAVRLSHDDTLWPSRAVNRPDAGWRVENDYPGPSGRGAFEPLSRGRLVAGPNELSGDCRKAMV